MDRRLDDIDTTRSNMLENVLKAVQKRFPVQNQRYTLAVADLEYDSTDPAPIKAQKAAILGGHSLTHKLNGTWQLIDNETGKVVDERRTIVAHVPMLTNRGTYIYNGSEYVVGNQLRLRPGPYTRVASTGEVETHVNVIPGTGAAFRVQMEPETGVFKLKVGQSHVPLLPVLRALGVQDSKISKVWGTELFNVNSKAAASDKQAVQKVYDRMVNRKVPGESQAAAINNQFSRMEVDDDILERNLGRYLKEIDDGPGEALAGGSAAAAPEVQAPSPLAGSIGLLNPVPSVGLPG